MPPHHSSSRLTREHTTKWGALNLVINICEIILMVVIIVELGMRHCL
jgi:hypothetical protein